MGIFYRKIRIWMDMDPAERGGVEWVSEFCPVKGSSSLYRPPSKLASELDRDLDELENQVQSALSRYSGQVVLCGDLNCNINVSGNGGSRLLQLMSRYGLQQCVKPGSVTYRPSLSLLDVIFTNRSDRVARSGTLLCSGVSICENGWGCPVLRHPCMLFFFL